MDRQTFIGRSLGEQNFAIGVLHENELHITPLKNVALLRPSFKYIDKGDKRNKKDSKDMDGKNKFFHKGTIWVRTWNLLIVIN